MSNAIARPGRGAATIAVAIKRRVGGREKQQRRTERGTGRERDGKRERRMSGEYERREGEGGREYTRAALRSVAL